MRSMHKLRQLWINSFIAAVLNEYRQANEIDVTKWKVKPNKLANFVWAWRSVRDTRKAEKIWS